MTTHRLDKKTNCGDAYTEMPLKVVHGDSCACFCVRYSAED